MHDYRRSYGRHLAHRFCGEHRDSNTAVTRRNCRHRRISMYRDASRNVVRIVEPAQRAFSPLFEFAIDFERASRRVGYSRHSAFVEWFVVARRDGKYMRRFAVLADYKEDLFVESDFDVTVTGFEGRRRVCCSNSLQLFGG